MSGSDSDEENVIKYGTPLEPYEEDEIPSKRKFQQPSDQYAVDAHGRRRFHGAFTGGFSAGYGNSVGTLEGWTPASFKSSRSEKADISNQKPEDYMDDEDRGEFGIAPQRLQTSNEFSGQKRQRQRYHDGPIPGEPVLEQLIQAVHESAAVKMLRKMGWRDGQGVGSRLRKDEKRRAKQEHKVYACYMPPELRQETQQKSDDDSSDSELDYDTLFAPDDYEPYLLRRKSDRFGLGYSGLSRHSVLGGVGEYGDGAHKSHLLMKEKGKKVSIRGQAFGVGAFEADDDDIYASEDMSQYDFALGDAERRREKRPAPSSSKLQVLEGFVKASKPLPPAAKYPPPALPRDYVPAAAGARRSRFEPSAQPQRDQGLGRHELTAAARGAMLGETPTPKPNDQETAPTPISIGKVIDMTKPIQKAEKDFIPLSTGGSDVVPKVFKPFINDPAKQARYERYLEGGAEGLEGAEVAGGLCEWERSRERLEFEQSARLYRPLTGLMSDRFTHAAQPDDAVNPLTAVSKSATNYGLATPEQVEAAKKGVYGVMTRKEAPWRPETLVCKRFNVPELGGDRSAPAKQDKPKLSYSVFSYLETSVHDRQSFTKEQSKFSGSKSVTDTSQPNKTADKRNEVTTTKTDSEPIRANKRMTVAELFLKESENDLKTTKKVEETIEKFDKIDLYKSIFLSDSEPEPEEATEAKTDNYIDKPKNIERNLSPTRGIFANIDFDELNSWKRQDKKTETPAKTKDSETAINKDVRTKDTVEEETVYGPKIPDNLIQRITSNANDDNYKPVFRDKSKKDYSSSSDSWVDANEVKSKKQKKKKVKKHKSKHKKAKHKKKDK